MAGCFLDGEPAPFVREADSSVVWQRFPSTVVDLRGLFHADLSADWSFSTRRSLAKMRRILPRPGGASRAQISGAPQQPPQIRWCTKFSALPSTGVRSARNS